MRSVWQQFVVLVVLGGCAHDSSLEQSSRTLPDSSTETQSDAGRDAPAPVTSGPSPRRETPSSAAVAPKPNSADSPTISTSPGPEGGFVILWPRIVATPVTEQDRSMAREVQARTRALIERTVQGRRVEIRPEPERSCRRAGCIAVSVAFVLARQEAGCILVVAIAPPGESSSTLVPWVGSVKLARGEVPFREPPESEITITDHAACDDLDALMRAAEGPVVEALRRAQGS